ncbi:MAG TPA: hypothetical protein VJ927_11330 [Actinomycetota bacterium]|nr:hypothetical protein [Actinomycetota bacterium]
MTGWILFGVLVLAISMAAFLLSRIRGARRRAAYPEPGGPRARLPDGAPDVAAVKSLAERAREWRTGGY